MLFTLAHPRDPNVTAEYGWDHALGYFATVVFNGKVRLEYDCLQVGGSTDLRGTLEFLAGQGVIHDLDEALVWHADVGTGRVPKRYQRALEVLVNLKGLNG